MLFLVSGSQQQQQHKLATIRSHGTKDQLITPRPTLLTSIADVCSLYGSIQVSPGITYFSPESRQNPIPIGFNNPKYSDLVVKTSEHQCIYTQHEVLASKSEHFRALLEIPRTTLTLYEPYVSVHNYIRYLHTGQLGDYSELNLDMYFLAHEYNDSALVDTRQDRVIDHLCYLYVTDQTDKLLLKWLDRNLLPVLHSFRATALSIYHFPFAEYRERSQMASLKTCIVWFIIAHAWNQCVQSEESLTVQTFKSNANNNNKKKKNRIETRRKRFSTNSRFT